MSKTDPWLSIAEAAVILGRTESAVYRLAREIPGKLPLLRAQKVAPDYTLKTKRSWIEEYLSNPRNQRRRNAGRKAGYAAQVVPPAPEEGTVGIRDVANQRLANWPNVGTPPHRQ